MKGNSNMKTAVWILATLVGLSPLLFAAKTSKSPAILLQEALYQEETEGNLDKAIQLYEQVLELAADQEQLTGKATYHLGQCYQKQGNRDKAVQYFQKVVADYSDQTAIAQQAVNQLEKLNASIPKSSLPRLDVPRKDIDPATLMPPDTLAYIELGSPGDHIETILNMLKGTPFENPLAVLGNGSNQTQKNPGDIFGALMNPSMVTEFKKIQGLAVGFIEIRSDNPSIIAALFPGESDALRGLLLAGLGMVGSPAEPMEGMNTFNIENSAGVAYDDHVILIAQPMELLSQVVKQYKRQTDEPSLSSNNKAFSKISRESRQSNIATIWVDPDEVFGRIQGLIPPEHFPEELSVANQLVDFGSLDNFMVQLKLKEDRIAIDATLSLKEGHQCLPYDLIHTPNLTPAGLSAIPENAVLSASFCLGDADSAGAEKVQDQLSRLTGLDIGRELFDNIEQINLFIVEPKNTADVGALPFGHIALSITSKNPLQTKGLMEQLLGVVSLVAKTSGGFDSIENDPQNGIYTFPVSNEMVVTCYLKQKGNTTLLGLSEPVAAASVRSSADTVNAVTTGALSPVFSDLSPNASKLITGNVGGMLRVADTCVIMMCNNPRNPAHEYIRQLSKSFDKTYICVETLEQDNELSLCASLEGIPKLGAIFPQVMRLSGCNITDKGCAKRPSPANGGCVAPNQACRLTWQEGLAGVKTHRVYFGTSENDLKLYQEVAEATDIKGPELNQTDATYYWRVDEIFEDGSVVIGDVWHFGTGKLIGKWKLDEDSGSIAKDSSGSGYDATLENMAEEDCRVKGVDGLALKLDGIDDRVSIPPLNLNSNTVTITAWIKRDGQQEGNDAGIIFCRDAGTTAGLCFYHDSMNLGYNWNNDRQTWDWDSGLPIPDNKWVMISLVVEPTQTTLYLGEDGNLKSATRKLHHAAVGFDGKTYIGHDTEQYVGGRHFKGTIDDVRFYNYSLSESEIRQILESGKTKEAQ